MLEERPLKGRALTLGKDESEKHYLWLCSGCYWTFPFSDPADPDDVPTPSEAIAKFNAHKCEDYPQRTRHT